MGIFDPPKTTSNQNSVTEPWSKQSPFLQYGFDEAARLYGQKGPNYFPNSTVAGFAPEQMQAYQLGTDRALQGNETVNQAESYAQDVLSGKYLNSDPYNDAVFQNVQQKVQPAVNTQWSNSGRYGSQLHAGDLTDRLTTAFSPYASQIYQSERGRMDGAMGMAPTFAQQDWTNLGALENVGKQKQDLAQQEIDDQVARWDYYANQPGAKLDEYMARIMGNYGGTQSGTSTSKTKQGIGNTILGGAASLLGGFL
jgi:hypothetical protein